MFGTLRLLPVLVPLLLTGCPGRITVDPPETTGEPPETNGEPPQMHERFVGEWKVDQPFHALYEASWYLFHEGGQLEHLRDCSFGGPVPTGFVSDAGDSLRCQFGERWSAPDANTLVIEGACSDGHERDIVLGFPEDTTADATGQSAIEVVSVGGEAGWGHFMWDWAWQKCLEPGCVSFDPECP
jgi:hypothetical protein